MNRRRFCTTRTAGQALVLVALTLTLLVTLIVGANSVALARRTQARIQNSLDVAAAAAATQLVTSALAADRPQIDASRAEATFRTTLRLGLMRVTNAVTPDPATLAQQARVVLVEAGGRCRGVAVPTPAVCAEVTVTVPGVFGQQLRTFTTLALAARSHD